MAVARRRRLQLTGSAVADRSAAAARRLRENVPAILMIAAAVFIAHSLAFYALGHDSPALACTVAISSLGLTRDASPRRVFETATAMTTGIGLSALFVTVVGRGALQVVVTIVVVLVLSSLVSSSPAFAVSAAVQAALVAVLPDPAGGPFMRAVDGALGGAVALALTVLLPLGAFRREQLTGKAVMHSFVTLLRATARSVQSADVDVNTLARENSGSLGRAFALWVASADSARAVSRVSFLRAAERSAWARRAVMAQHLRAAAVGVDAILRRGRTLAQQGKDQPEAAELIDALADSVNALVFDHAHPDHRTARNRLVHIAEHTGVLAVHRGVDPGLMALVRLVIVDCLVAAGDDQATARGRLPEIVDYRPATRPFSRPR